MTVWIILFILGLVENKSRNNDRTSVGRESRVRSNATMPRFRLTDDLPSPPPLPRHGGDDAGCSVAPEVGCGVGPTDGRKNIGNAVGACCWFGSDDSWERVTTCTVYLYTLPR